MPTVPNRRQAQRSLRRAGVAFAAVAAVLLVAAVPVLWREYAATLGTAGRIALSVAGVALLVLAALVVRTLRDGQSRLREVFGQLRATADSLREAQQIARMGHWQVSLPDRRITLSPELCGLMDGALAPGTYEFEAALQQVHPGDRARLRRVLASTLESGLPFDTEYRALLPDGSERVMRARGAMRSASDGSRWLAGTSQDISGPAAARESLRRAQAQYRLLFDRNPLPMWIYDVESLRFLAVNAAAVQQYGYSEQEFLERSLRDIRPPDELADLEAAVHQWGEPERRARVWTHLRRDGSQLHVSVFSTDIQFDDRPARLVLVQDVTARVRAEQERIRSETRFSVVARAASDAIYDWDVACGSLWWSDGFYGLFRYTPESMPPTIESWEALIHPDDRKAALDSLQHAIDGRGERWEHGYRFRRADGVYANVEDRGHFLRDSEGTVVRMIGAMLDVTARQADEARLRQAQAELAHRATHDALTGLPNRALITERLAAAIRDCEAGAPQPVVVFIGLDHFKLINDTLGHAVGDRVLVAVAERLSTIDEPAAIVGRFGGDEFVVIFPERDDLHSTAVIARIVAALTTPLEVLDTLHYLTPSIGWGVYPQAGDDAGTMLKNADLAMYQAKQRGRNNVMRYASELSVVVAERLRLVSRLRRALASDEFTLHFQPKFRTGDLAPTGLEALLRWNDPDRGLVAPGEFIGVAEDSGLIVPIGRWVLREAARHHRLLAEAGLASLSIAVNVAPPQFQRGELFDDLRALVAEFALPAGALEIELTENVILDNPELAIEQMQRLRALGVRVAIDDFGTGYSSLGYLRRLPVDVLKIDRSFIADLDGDAESAAVCAAIIRLAHDLGRTVIAEGVETEAQLAWLRAHACDGLQGFLFARPMPFAQALQVLGPR